MWKAASNWKIQNLMGATQEKEKSSGRKSIDLMSFSASDALSTETKIYQG
jgi:hypothetical protein